MLYWFVHLHCLIKILIRFASAYLGQGGCLAEQNSEIPPTPCLTLNTFLSFSSDSLRAGDPYLLMLPHPKLFSLHQVKEEAFCRCQIFVHVSLALAASTLVCSVENRSCKKVVK